MAIREMANAPGAAQKAVVAPQATLVFYRRDHAVSHVGLPDVPNDMLVYHLKTIFDLSYAQVMLVQFAFFSAYLLFSLP